MTNQFRWYSGELSFMNQHRGILDHDGLDIQEQRDDWIGHDVLEILVTGSAWALDTAQWELEARDPDGDSFGGCWGASPGELDDGNFKFDPDHQSFKPD